MADQERITREDVVAFAGELEEWGDRLPPKHRVLLQLLIDRSGDVEPPEVEGYNFGGLRESYLSGHLSLLLDNALTLGTSGGGLQMRGDLGKLFEHRPATMMARPPLW